MLKKRKSEKYNWTFKYIKDYNEMVAYYEKQLKEKDETIKWLEEENNKLVSVSKLRPKMKQISDKDIIRIKKLKEEGFSYSYISNETGWSKATISRVVNNK